MPRGIWGFYSRMRRRVCERTVGHIFAKNRARSIGPARADNFNGHRYRKHHAVTERFYGSFWGLQLRLGSNEQRFTDREAYTRSLFNYRARGNYRQSLCDYLEFGRLKEGINRNQTLLTYNHYCIKTLTKHLLGNVAFAHLIYLLCVPTLRNWKMVAFVFPKVDLELPFAPCDYVAPIEVQFFSPTLAHQKFR